jgi:hypothetical protein
MTDTRGKVSMRTFGREGLVGHNTSSDWSFLYETSLVKDSNWWIGDKVVLPDGREFHYAKSKAAITTNLGCNFTATGYVAVTAFATSHAVGSTTITIPAATHAALTENELRGGYVVIFDGAATSYVQVRGIVGNRASILNVAFEVDLDAPIVDAIVSGTEKVEVYQNPFAAIGQDNSVVLPRAGTAACAVSAASTYFWVQTKGVTWLSPQSGVGADNGGITAFWRHDGSLQKAETALAVTVAANDTSQEAGFCIEGSAAGNGPLFYLGKL